MATKAHQEYTELELEATINRVVTENYSHDSDQVAKVQTTVRLGGKFSRGDVSALIANIVTRLMVAFDQAEAADSDQADGASGPEEEESSAPHLVE